MCLGGSKNTGTKNEVVQLPPWLDQAAQGVTYSAMQNLDRPFVAYGGDRVAGLTGDETASHDILRSLAGSGNPYSGDIESMYRSFGSAGPQSVSAPRLIDDIGQGGNMAAYMNPYIQGVLDPQLREIGKAGQQQRLDINKMATASGAFGDSRHGVLEGQQRTGEIQAVGDATGRAWSDAFNNAMGLRNLDVNRMLDIGKTNAMFGETALNRQRQAGSDLMGLDKYDTGRMADLAQLLGGAGATQRGVDQAQKDFDFSEFMRQQGWSLDTAKQIASIIGALPYGKSTTTTTEAPNNTGWQLLGALGGMFLSDRRAKTEIAEVGRLYDGTPVYRYRYKHGGPMMIGVMAQDIEQTKPDAVIEVDGLKFVDYEAATRDAVVEAA